MGCPRCSSMFWRFALACALCLAAVVGSFVVCGEALSSLLWHVLLRLLLLLLLLCIWLCRLRIFVFGLCLSNWSLSADFVFGGLIYGLPVACDLVPCLGGVMVLYLVGCLEHVKFSQILGIIFPSDFHIFQRV